MRAKKTEALSDEEWADYLFMRTNPKGVHYERWMHVFGCRRWFNVARHTVTGEIYGSYQIGDDKPAAALEAQKKQ